MQPNNIPKVLHVCETAKGGIGTYINTLCKITSDHYINIVIAPDIHRHVLNDSIDVHEFRHSGRGIGTLVRLAWATLSAIYRLRPDIVFYHSSFALFPMALARCVFWRKPFIYCAHGWADGRETKENLKKIALRKIEGSLCGFATIVVNVSQNDLFIARRNKYIGQQILIENAVEEIEDLRTEAKKAEKERLNLLFVGRLDRQKGLDLLLPAFSTAKAIRKELFLTIVGDQVLDTTAAYKNVEGVSFTGWLAPKEVAQQIANSDIVVIPSRWEGLPLVLPEALRAGTPVLVSNQSQLPSLIENGVSGIVTELTKESLTAVLIGLDKNFLHAMRPACRNLFQSRYHASRLKDDIIELFQKVLKG